MSVEITLAKEIQIEVDNLFKFDEDIQPPQIKCPNCGEFAQAIYWDKQHDGFACLTCVPNPKPFGE